MMAPPYSCEPAVMMSYWADRNISLCLTVLSWQVAIANVLFPAFRIMPLRELGARGELMMKSSSYGDIKLILNIQY